MKYKAICFDLDGTLYSRKILNRKMLKFSLLHPFLSEKYSKMRQFFREVQSGIDKKGIKKEFDSLTFEEREIFLADKLGYRGGKIIPKYYKKLQKLYRKLEKNTDVSLTLQMIKNCQITVAVLTDWPIYSKINLLGLDIPEKNQFYSGDCGFLKPDARCFGFMLESLKLKSSEVLFVGDSYEKDIIGASACKIDSVLIGYKNKKGKYPKAFKVFEDWDAFKLWLKGQMVNEQLKNLNNNLAKKVER